MSRRAARIGSSTAVTNRSCASDWGAGAGAAAATGGAAAAAATDAAKLAAAKLAAATASACAVAASRGDFVCTFVRSRSLPAARTLLSPHADLDEDMAAARAAMRTVAFGEPGNLDVRRCAPVSAAGSGAGEDTLGGGVGGGGERGGATAGDPGPDHTWLHSCWVVSVVVIPLACRPPRRAE